MMGTRRVFIGILLVAVASPNWSRAASERGPAVASLAESCDGSNSICTGSTCAECCSDPLPCNMCPRVYGEVEWLFLKRSTGQPDRTLLINASNQAVLASSSDLSFDFDSGARALIGFQLCGCVPVEFGYFGLCDSVASLEYMPQQGVNATLPGPLGVASNVFHDNVTVQVDYRSRIQGAEVNFPCCFCCEDPCGDYATSKEFFAGFRYVSLREDILIFGAKPVQSGIETGYYDTNSRNDLYGAQVGSRIRRCRGRFSLEGTAKVGIFYNQAGQEQVFVDFPNFLLRPSVSANGNNVACVSELNLTGIYQLNRTWGLRAGYNVMWIEGVALAPNQLDFSFASTSGTGLHAGGGLFLHGVNVGLEARW